jgi:AcrR family transcriptional regulator
MSSVSEKSGRIPAAQRRELILHAATDVFGTYGYAGSTTDQVARAAGISQPYVVRMFGGKENLFVEVMDRTLARLLVTFRAAIADTDDERSAAGRIARAYVDLVKDRGIMLTLMQGFMLGSDVRVGAVARDGFMQIYRLLRDEAELSPEQARQFLANGMLINTVLASGLVATSQDDPDAAELMECLFGEKLDLVLGAESAASRR